MTLMARRFQFSLRTLFLIAIPAGLAFCLIQSFLRDPETFGRFGLAFWLCLIGCTAACVASLTHRGGDHRLALLTGVLVALIALAALAAQMGPR